MSKKILFLSSAKLTAISFGLLLVIFCTIGMSFRPVYGEDEMELVMSGPRRSHWTTSGTEGSGCNAQEVTYYNDKIDYAKTISQTLGNGYTTITDNTKKATPVNSTATTSGSQSYVEWNTGVTEHAESDKNKTAIAVAALEVAHTNEITFLATPSDPQEYRFVGWFSNSAGTALVSTENPYTATVVIPNASYGTSHNTQYESSTSPYTTTYYAKFEVIPANNVTFLAASTPARDNGSYTVVGKNLNQTITTSNQTIGVKGVTLTAIPSEATEFVRWFTQDGGGNRTTLSTENPYNAAFTAAATVGVEWRELTNHHNLTFKAPELDTNDNPVGTYTVNSTTVSTADYVYNTGDAYKFKPTMTATPATGYIFTGWYAKHGKRKDLLSTDNPWHPIFTQDSVICAGFAFNNYTDDQKAQFKVGSTYYTDLNAANTAAKNGSNKTIVCTRDGILPPGNYTISSGVTLYIPYSTSETSQTAPAMTKYDKTANVPALTCYRKLTMVDGANISCDGKICVGGQIAELGGGYFSGYPFGACGMIDMSNGGHIELNDKAILYAWGFIKGQDMDQGNNTLDVGTITANNGATVYEDFSGENRGGSACSALASDGISYKVFPFQGYAIQNIEIPVTYKYGSTLQVYTALYIQGNITKSFPMIASADALFLLSDGKSVVRKWYDPTTDLACYELSGTSQLSAIVTNIYVSINSANFNLPIASNMHIILNDCNMTLSNPIQILPDAIIEIKANATANLASNLFLYDVDDWQKGVASSYFASFKNLTNHKNRGDGSSKATLQDARLIVDGTLNVTGKIYSTTGGANIMSNGGGKISFPSALATSSNIYQCWGAMGGKETYDGVACAKTFSSLTGTKTYIHAVPVNSANLHNENDSYTQSKANKTFLNINGRWFNQTDGASTEKANHTYDFTYISSGAVSGTGGTNSTTDAVYSNDKTGLEARMKWFNVTADCNEGGHYWWHGQGDQTTWFYNWTLNSAWHQFLPTATEGLYSGSNNTLYTKSGCAWEELGSTDVNCLYEIGGVKKALVDGQFVALEPNNNDPAYHAADDATKYYICFSGCNWHEATKYENAEKAYVVDGDIFIWYDGAWMNAEWRDPFFYTLDETDVPIYYEYLNGEWVLSDPYIRVTDGLENRPYWFLDEAFAFASGALRKTPTIKILRDISGITTAVSYTGANKTCTLDLNGHTINGSVSSMLTINGAGCTFIIKDNTAEKKGKINLVFSANTRRYAVNVTKGHLKLQSGTISSTNTMLYSQGTSATSCAIIVKASQQCTIEGGTVYTQADYNPIGIYGDGNSSTITVKGGEVIASVGAKSEPRGIQVTGGTLNVQDDAVIEATTYAGGTTGEGILVNQNASYHATLNMTGGTVKSTTKSSSIGVYVNCTYTYDTNEPRTITAWSRAEAYISGGEIRVENKNGATAEGVRSLGTTEISGGRITVRPTTSTAIGVRLYDGTTTIKGTADIDVAATSVAYGVRISEEAPANKAGTVYNGTLNMTGGTLTVRTTGTTDAYGVYVGAASTKITTTHASNSSYYAGNYANAGTANISNGVIDVQAKTNKAYSVYVENPVSESGATGYATATATPNCSITGGKFKVASMTANATNIAATNVSTSTYTISGGYYNNQENVAGYTVAPKHVVTLPTTDANYPEYLYKVANSYLVTFMNGSETLQSTYQEEGKVPTYTEAEPTKASAGGFSYAFNGWSTSNDNTPAALTAVTSAGATYYACFEQTDLRYTISLDATTNGGECATEYIRVAPGAAAGELPSATKEGHTFTGWFTAASGGTQLTASTVVSGDITYYAQFTVNSYTLTYALGEGKVTTAGSPIPAKNKTGTQSQSVAYGTAITAPVVARTGYTFQSWDAIVAATMPAEDVTYTPLWIPNVNTKYTVKHYLQNVDGTYPADPVETQSLTGTTATSVTPAVKSYDGFISPATQTVTIAAAGTTVVEYQYARQTYTISLDAYTNGGTSDAPDITIIHGATIGTVPPDAQKGCNDFLGWFTKPVGGVKITSDFVIEYDMKKLYAQFSDDVRTYPITYLAGANGSGTVTDGTKTCGENATLSSSTFTRDGYAQTGWSTTDGGAQAYALGGTYTANASLTLYPVWAAVTYNLTYEGLNGATNSNPATYTIETATITLANPGTRAGYDFTGWTCGGSPITQIAIGSTGDKTITANWSVVTYSLTYEGLEGASNSNPATYTIETATITLADPGTRSGYTFTGWTCGGDPITQIALGSTGDKTITANWSAVTYNLTYEGLNGATNSNPATYTIETATITLANPGTRAGYDFTGWTCGGNPITQIALGSTGDKVITANWEQIGFTILWKSEDGAETLETDDLVLIGATPSFDGTAPTKATTTEYTYTFDGWTTEANGSGTFYAIGELPAVSAAATYYAHFSATANVASVKVGSADPTYYTNLADAFAAANSAESASTIKLLNNVSGIAASLVYSGTQNCTLDLNNHTIAGTVTKLIDVNATGTTFTIDDSSTAKGGKISLTKSASSRIYCLYITAGTVNLKHGIIYCKNSSTSTSTTKNNASAVYVAAGQKFIMDDGTVESISRTSSYALYIDKSTTSEVTINGGLIKGHTNSSTTAGGIYNYCTKLTINGGHIIGHAYTSTSYGINQYGKSTINGGIIEATNDTTSSKGTATAYGIFVQYNSSTYNGAITIPSSSTVQVLAKARTNTAFAVYISSGSSSGNTIAGGTFTAIAKTGKTAIGVYSFGTITISGGIFNVSTATTAAYGIYTRNKTTTVSGSPVFNVTSGSTDAYGAFAYGYVNAKGASKASGTIKVNGGTFNVTSGSTTAYGAYAGLYGLNIVQKGTEVGDTIFGQHYMPGIVEITDATFNVKATTTGAYGIVVSASKTESGAVGTTKRYPKATISGGKFKAESAGDDNATAYAMNASASATYLKVQGGKYSTKRTNATETSNIEDKYTAPTLTNNYHVLPLTGEDPYKYEVAEAYTITFNNHDGSTLQSGAVKKGATPVYSGETPTKAEDDDYTYTFDGWDHALATVTEEATYTAQYTSVSKETGFYVDIIDWTALTLTINANGWTASGWPYTINGTSYEKGDRATDRTLTIPYEGVAGTDLRIKVESGESITSLHNYKIPFINTTEDAGAEDTVYVNSGTLTISTNTTLGGLYVRPEASVEVESGKLLTVGKLVMRTLPWQAAAISGDFEAEEVWYTRIAPNKRTISGPDGEITYESASYYQFALPLSSTVALKDIKVSHGANTPYGSTWLLKYYNEESRAANGAGSDNWEALGENETVQGGLGYELFSNSNYYREFYFPLGAVNSASLGTTAAVRYDLGAAGEKHAGWNIVASPLMSVYDNSDADPETGMKVSILQTDGSYDQGVPEYVYPAIPFSYQATENQTCISFEGSSIVAAAPQRRVAAEDESVRKQWLHLDIKNDAGVGDHTSILSHPTRYEDAYKTGIDVAKQSLTASRAIIYSSHAYGDMAFAGVADSLLEQGVALTVYSPCAQELTFSMRGNDWLNRMRYVWLVDHATGARTDLLWDTYTFEATEGTARGRFTIEGVFRAPQITTDIENAEMMNDEMMKVRKVLINQKMYILRGDQMYDATGKKVSK